MEGGKIHNITETYRLYVSNSLEEYRCTSFFTKEPETIEWIKTFFKDGETFYDVGANVGVYSLYAAILYPRMQVYSFEPDLRNYLRLGENCSLNEVANVIPLYLALSDVTGVEKFFVRDERIGASGGQIGESKDEHGRQFTPLQHYPILTFMLDGLVDDLSVKSPHHIKIDVDGAEDRIIEGMRKTLRRSTLKSLLIEINRSENKSQAIAEEIRGCGFTEANRFNALPNHSRHRRKGTSSETAENVIFVRSSLA